MRKHHAIIFIMLALVMAFSMACGLTGSNNSLSSGEDSDAGDAGSSASSGNWNELKEQFTSDIQTPLYRDGKKSFKAEQFIARQVPVDIQFSGDPAPEVMLKGALAYPNYYISSNPPETLQVFFVMKQTQPMFLQMEISPMVNYADMEWTINLLDASGATLQTVQVRPDAVFPNYPQSISAYLDQVPNGVARVSITAVVTQRSIGNTCFTDEDLDFQFPYDVFPHTPILISYGLHDWFLGDAPQENVIGQMRMRVKNIHDIGLTESLKIFFLDEANTIVGFGDFNNYLDPYEVEEFYSESELYTSYLSAIPSSALVVFDDIDICNLMEATR